CTLRGRAELGPSVVQRRAERPQRRRVTVEADRGSRPGPEASVTRGWAPTSGRAVATGLIGLWLGLALVPRPVAADQAEMAQVVAFAGSGAGVLQGSRGHVYGLVYAGMAGSQPAQDAFAGFHEFASQAHGQRVLGQVVRIEPTGVIGVTPEGMTVLVGHAYLPGAEVPVAADLL